MCSILHNTDSGLNRPTQRCLQPCTVGCLGGLGPRLTTLTNVSLYCVVRELVRASLGRLRLPRNSLQGSPGEHAQFDSQINSWKMTSSHQKGNFLGRIGPRVAPRQASSVVHPGVLLLRNVPQGETISSLNGRKESFAIFTVKIS